MITDSFHGIKGQKGRIELKKPVLFALPLFIIGIFLFIWISAGKKEQEKLPYIAVKTGTESSISETDIVDAPLEADQEPEESLSYAQYIFQQRKLGIAKSATVMREKSATDDTGSTAKEEKHYQEPINEVPVEPEPEISQETIGEDEGFEVNGISFASAEDVGAVKTKGSGVNMRAVPSETGRLITKIDDGIEVSVTGVSDDWLEIEYNGELGYIKREFLLMGAEEP